MHLLPPGWPGRQRPLTWRLSVPPWARGGLSLEAGPKGLGCPCQTLLPFLLWQPGLEGIPGRATPIPPRRLSIKLIAVTGRWRGKAISGKPLLSTQTVALAGGVMGGQ